MTQSAQIEQVRVLKLTLHGQLVGYLAGFQGGRNSLTLTLWPQALDSLPMNPEHKRSLRHHWQTLEEDFQVK